MTWLASPTGTRRPAFATRPWVTSICSWATFDGGPDDPRTLVYEYQQDLRAELLDELAYEEIEDDRPSRWVVTFAACQGALSTCEDGLRWLWLAEPRRAAASDAPAATAPTEIAAPAASATPAQTTAFDGVAQAALTIGDAPADAAPIAAAPADAPILAVVPGPSTDPATAADQSAPTLSLAA